VNNGGYRQYFGNYAFRAAVVEALIAIGCERTAAATARAIAALGSDGGRSPDAAEQAVLKEDPARDELLHQCDGEYYDSGEDIATLLFTHIEKNAGEVRIP